MHNILCMAPFHIKGSFICLLRMSSRATSVITSDSRFSRRNLPAFTSVLQKVGHSLQKSLNVEFSSESVLAQRLPASSWSRRATRTMAWSLRCEASCGAAAWRRCKIYYANTASEKLGATCWCESHARPAAWRRWRPAIVLRQAGCHFLDRLGIL